MEHRTDARRNFAASGAQYGAGRHHRLRTLEQAPLRRSTHIHPREPCRYVHNAHRSISYGRSANHNSGPVGGSRHRHHDDQRKLHPFQFQNQIKGLTTSVGLWCCGIVGLALGAGLYTLALVLFAALLCSMSGLPALETHLKDRSNHFEVHLELKNKLDLPDFVSTVRALGIRIDDIESNPAYLNSGLSVFTVSFTVDSAELKQYKKHGEIIEALRSLDYVYYIEEMN